MYIYTYLYMYIYIHVYKYTDTHTHTYTYTYTNICIHTHTHTPTHTNTHTYTHTGNVRVPKGAGKDVVKIEYKYVVERRKGTSVEAVWETKIVNRKVAISSEVMGQVSFDAVV